VSVAGVRVVEFGTNGTTTSAYERPFNATKFSYKSRLTPRGQQTSIWLVSNIIFIVHL